MSHVAYEWVMSHMNESCHIWMSHVTSITCNGRVRMNLSESCNILKESCPIWMSHVSYEWVVSHIWMNHVPYKCDMSHMNESCRIWMSHVTSNTCTGRVRMSLNGTWLILKESCPIWMSHVPYEWAMSHQIHVLEECTTRVQMNLNVSRHVQKEYVPYDYITHSYGPIWLSHCPHEWVKYHKIYARQRFWKHTHNIWKHMHNIWKHMHNSENTCTIMRLHHL